MSSNCAAQKSSQGTDGKKRQERKGYKFTFCNSVTKPNNMSARKKARNNMSVEPDCSEICYRVCLCCNCIGLQPRGTFWHAPSDPAPARDGCRLSRPRWDSGWRIPPKSTRPGQRARVVVEMFYAVERPSKPAEPTLSGSVDFAIFEVSCTCETDLGPRSVSALIYEDF